MPTDRAADSPRPPARRSVGAGVHRVAARLGRRQGRVVAVAARLARTFVDAHEATRGGRYDIDTNGERTLVERLRGDLDTVIDVGANVGDWSAIASECGATTIHAFEISPTTADELARRFATQTNVVVNRFGLGDVAGTVTIHHYPDQPALTTTATEFSHDAAYEVLDVEVRTGAHYAATHGVTAVDLLKIDVEGAEPAVLRGFEPLLATGAIAVVQFEYGVVAMIDRFVMRDFYDYLGGFGYRIGPLHPDGVAFSDYNLGLERFDFVNFVAVHESRPDLATRLRRPG